MGLNGQNFGGSPSDRNYPLAKTFENDDPSLTFHGCPAMYEGKMLIFGAGPDMKKYLEKMYRDYDDYDTYQERD